MPRKNWRHEKYVTEFLTQITKGLRNFKNTVYLCRHASILFSPRLTGVFLAGIQ